MKVLKKLLISLIYIIVVFIVFLLAVFFKLSTVQLRDISDYETINIQEDFTYEMMISPPRKYSALLQIDLPTRKKVAKYMKKHHYKLKSGKQEFIKNNPTLKELLNQCFIFEKMDE